MSENFLNQDGPYEPYTRCLHFGAQELRVLITTSGAVQVKRYCADCDTPQTGALAHKLLIAQGVTIDDLPVHADCREEVPPCEHCGSALGVERHHWAPRHLFGSDAYGWPVGYLCQNCHREWHKVVTPDMAKKAS